jgi:hypothetical protein
MLSCGLSWALGRVELCSKQHSGHCSKHGPACVATGSWAAWAAGPADNCAVSGRSACCACLRGLKYVFALPSLHLPPTKELQLVAHQRSRAAGRHVACDGGDRRLIAVAHAEGVVDKHVCQLAQLGCKGVVVAGLGCVEASVLQQARLVRGGGQGGQASGIWRAVR